MNLWTLSMGLGLIAATVAIIAFVRYRAQESTRLLADLGLSERLRTVAGADAVRLAAVDEFETGVYRRLFYAGVVGPRVRSAAWSLLGLILAVAAALAIGPLDGGSATAAYVLAGIFAVGFGVAAAVNAGLAIYHTAATPRVSFDESSDGAGEVATDVSDEQPADDFEPVDSASDDDKNE
ncbi:hypothetical protein [Gordonia effusa]|uniref:hypothetical protein n=1 Tax=Gordonia effusa TaxID=263908 RepID=UPI001FE09137|nr:hypothetical protein [Gordonia effusa]